MVAALLLLVACSDSGSAPSIVGGASSVATVASSGVASSTVPLSSGVAPSSSAADTSTGDHITESANLAAPTGVAVSRWAALSTLILKWDPPDYDPSTVTGIVVERDDNYTGWDALDTMTGDAIRNGLYTDTDLAPTTEMRYRYRLYTLKIDSVTGVPKRSAFSSIVGTMALDAIGFGATGFDLPANFTGCWWNLRDVEIRWGVLKMSQENGWVVQGLASDNHVDTIPDGLNSSGPVDVSRAVWINMDTLTQDNNHFWVYNSPISHFRIYSYFLNDFSGVTSEFSPELGLADKCANFCIDDWNCDAPAALAVDTTLKAISWKPTKGPFQCQLVQASYNGNSGFYPATCAGNPSCRTVKTDAGRGNPGQDVPCWSITTTSMSLPAYTGLFTFTVASAALNADGDSIWHVTTWADPAK